MMLALAE